MLAEEQPSVLQGVLSAFHCISATLHQIKCFANTFLNFAPSREAQS